MQLLDARFKGQRDFGGGTRHDGIVVGFLVVVVVVTSIKGITHQLSLRFYLYLSTNPHTPATPRIPVAGGGSVQRRFSTVLSQCVRAFARSGYYTHFDRIHKHCTPVELMIHR